QWKATIAQALAGGTSGYFCCVEAGTYTIGSTEDDSDAQEDEKPQHLVTFDAPFYIARYPITNEQWQAWVTDGGLAVSWADDSDLNHSNQPVVGVTWHLAKRFCTWLSVQANASLRLPTEAEWEGAARSSDAYRYPWGDIWQNDCAATAED